MGRARKRDELTDGQTERKTDGQGDSNLAPATFCGGGIIIYIVKCVFFLISSAKYCGNRSNNDDIAL